VTSSPTRVPAYPPPRQVDILLVEHSAPEAELTLKALRELNPKANVETARDGEEALDFLLGRGAFRHNLGGPVPRLVLLHLRLARIDGLEVLSAIRSNSRTSLVPVVVLTSSADPRELAQCYRLGANSCVQKPVRYEEFRAAMHAVVHYWLGLSQPPPPPEPLS
jgi:two-component system, response regulator